MSMVTPSSAVAAATPPGRQDSFYEIVNGQYVEVPPMGAYETTLASFLCLCLGQFASARRLGRCVTETLFVLDAKADRRRRPDVAFVSYDRWARGRRVPREEAWDVVPNLAVEVVSPTNTSGADIVKLQDYFRAGVERVWVIYPDVEQVYVYASPTEVRILARTDALDGDPLLPGFRLPVAQVFACDLEAN